MLGGRDTPTGAAGLAPVPPFDGRPRSRCVRNPCWAAAASCAGLHSEDGSRHCARAGPPALGAVAGAPRPVRATAVLRAVQCRQRLWLGWLVPVARCIMLPDWAAASHNCVTPSCASLHANAGPQTTCCWRLMRVTRADSASGCPTLASQWRSTSGARQPPWRARGR